MVGMGLPPLMMNWSFWHLFQLQIICATNGRYGIATADDKLVVLALVSIKNNKLTVQTIVGATNGRYGVAAADNKLIVLALVIDCLRLRQRQRLEVQPDNDNFNDVISKICSIMTLRSFLFSIRANVIVQKQSKS
jgi:hypothetical protein